MTAARNAAWGAPNSLQTVDWQSFCRQTWQATSSQAKERKGSKKVNTHRHRHLFDGGLSLEEPGKRVRVRGREKERERQGSIDRLLVGVLEWDGGKGEKKGQLNG